MTNSTSRLGRRGLLNAAMAAGASPVLIPVAAAAANDARPAPRKLAPNVPASAGCLAGEFKLSASPSDVNAASSSLVLPSDSAADGTSWLRLLTVANGDLITRLALATVAGTATASDGPP